VSELQIILLPCMEDSLLFGAGELQFPLNNGEICGNPEILIRGFLIEWKL
jgi:hypothetical protein